MVRQYSTPIVTGVTSPLPAIRAAQLDPIVALRHEYLTTVVKRDRLQVTIITSFCYFAALLIEFHGAREITFAKRVHCLSA